jgi:hypothetical protein
MFLFTQYRITGEVETKFNLDLVQDGGEWSASCLVCFAPWGKNCHYPLSRRLGGLQRYLGNFGE